MIQTDLFGKPVPMPAAPSAEHLPKPRRIGEVIMDYFHDHPYQSFTAHQVRLALGQQWPTESVRNAIQRLIMQGHIIVTGEQRPGLDGEPCQCYIYSKTKRVWKKR